MAQARALLQGRDHVLPDDIKALAHPVLGHRLIMANGTASAGAAVDALVAQTPVSN